MQTKRQESGNMGEILVARHCNCPKCKNEHTLKKLSTNFKCADVICDFCGYVAQVKTLSVNNIAQIPNTILGAAWSVQKERMDAGIYFPLFIVLRQRERASRFSIYYLPIDFQTKKMFRKRPPLAKTAKRAGWQGFIYELNKIDKNAIMKVYQSVDK